ncbi:MAG TPA: hypothetical protein VF121_17950 [Thermoanaerobaculia bacterium]|nr:hypothetical protein [Thermoanaerobaculia bacterium]
MVTAIAAPSLLAHSRPRPAVSDRGQAVRVALLDGEELQGRVQLFSATAHDFLLHAAGAEAVDRLITFESVRSVAFLRPLRAGAAVADTVTFHGSARLVTLRLVDGELLSGITHSFGGPRRGLFVVPAGQPDVERLFVPITAVREVVSVERLEEVVASAGATTRDMVERALARRRHAPGQPAAADRLRRLGSRRQRAHPSPLGEILVGQGSISRAELAAALAAQHRQPGRKVGELIVEMGYASSKMVAVALALQYGVPFLSLSGRRLDPALRALVPAEVALRLRALPLAREGELLRVAVEDPAAPSVAAELEERTGLRVAEAVVTPQELERGLALLYG